MRSTSNNLSNPLINTELHVPFENQIGDPVSIVKIDHLLYDQMQVKDPETIYLVQMENGSIHGYYGDTRINDFREHVHYVMGLDPLYKDVQIIYMNLRTRHADHLIEVARYKNLQQAMDVLNFYTRGNSHEKMITKLQMSLIQQVKEPIPVHDFIIGIISMCGYQEDPRLQNLIQSMQSYGAADDPNDIGRYALIMLHQLRNTKANELFRYYSDIYDYLMTLDFLKTKTYTKDPEHVNWAPIIQKILMVFH